MAKGKKRPPYFKCYVDDWDDGVRDLTLEQDGFYGRFLRAQWRAQGPLVDSPAALARTLRLDLRLVRRLTDELVNLGKLKRGDGAIWNPRMLRDIRRYDARAKETAQAGNPQRELPFTDPGGPFPASGLGGARPHQSTRSQQRPVGMRTLGEALADLGRNSRNVPP